MYAPYYGYPPLYSPYPFYYTDNEEGEGYYSGEEKHNQVPEENEPPKIVITDTLPQEQINSCDEECTVENKVRPGLQSIPSVSNIKVYDETTESVIEEANSDDSTDEDEESHSVYVIDDETATNHLSTIYEESERSDSRFIRESSVTTTVSEDFTYVEDNKHPIEEAIAPLTISINLLENKKEEEEKDWWEILKSDDTREEVQETEYIEETTEEETEKDFWKELSPGTDQETRDVDYWEKRISKHSVGSADVQDDDACSTSSSDSSCSESEASEIKQTDYVGTEPDRNDEEEVEIPSIQDRINSLRRSSVVRQSSTEEKIEEDLAASISVKERISVFETSSLLQAGEAVLARRHKLASNASSRKSLEDYSEEDSGVTSDLSRHISEAETGEEFPELRKMSKYQRAATHSRLYKLLQDGIEDEEDDDDDDTKASTNDTPRRDLLTLPLNMSESESFSSSGINSPGSGEFVNERLVHELVQSMLTKAKGQIFRGMSMEKLHAAAVKILQEDVDVSSDECSSFLSPLKSATQSSTPAQTPQEFYGNYNEYKQYYDSWSEAAVKELRLLQEKVKCPRVLNAKRSLEGRSTLTNPETTLDPSEATDAS